MKVVTIGNGTGHAQVIQALIDLNVELTSVVGITDNGGHSGVLRDLFRIPSVGDVRSCVTSSCQRDGIMRFLLSYRFKKSVMDGTSLGNLILTALMEREGGFQKAIDAIQAELGLRNRIVAVAETPADVCAELADGTTVRGEWQILQRPNPSQIRKIFVAPPTTASGHAIAAIAKADAVIVAPGAFYTGIMATLAFPGICTAIRKSKGKWIYICNSMTQHNQTDGFGVSAHVNEIRRIVGRPPDRVIMNRDLPPKWVLEIYARDRSFPVKLDLDDSIVARERLLHKLPQSDADQHERGGKGKMRVLPHFVRHDPKKLRLVLQRVLKR